MKKFRLYGVVTGSKYLGEVEAETSTEAIEQAGKLDMVWASLCHQCSKECEDPMIHDITAEEVEE